MNRPLLWVVVLGAAAAGFLGGAAYNQRERVSAAGLRARTVLYYVDPMHPEYRSDSPGVAPDCGMKLEPIYADAAQETVAASASPAMPGTIRVTAEKQQLIGVRVEPVEVKPAAARLRLYGRVAADETRAYTVNIGIDGFVREVSAVTTGSRVRKNQWLATYSAPEARQAIQGYLVALNVLERTVKGGEDPLQTTLAQAGVQQAADRLVTLGMSSGQLDEIARTKEVPVTIDIVSPVDGFVLSRNISTGQRFTRGDEIYRIADISRVWILADVFGRDADYVRPGMEAHVVLPGRGRSFGAVINGDAPPQFDQASQSTKIRLDVANRDGLLRPDMFVDVELPIQSPPAVTVPTEAVLDSGVRKIVFVERAAGTFEPREVETGGRFGDRLEIVRGLTAGERVVVSGTFLLDSESRINHVAPEQSRR